MSIPGEKRHPIIPRHPNVQYTTPEQYRRYRAEAVQLRIARAVETIAAATATPT